MPPILKVYDARLLRVIDGDTIYVVPTEYSKLRLLGVQTPEKGQEGYEYSTQLVKEWIGNDELRIVYEKEDSFGRQLAVVYRKRDGANLNDFLQGWGYRYTVQEKRWWEKLLDFFNIKAIIKKITVGG